MTYWASTKDADIFHEINAAGLRAAVEWARVNVHARDNERVIVALAVSDHGRTSESTEMVASYRQGQAKTSCLSATALAAYEGIDYYAAVERFKTGGAI